LQNLPSPSTLRCPRIVYSVGHELPPQTPVDRWCDLSVTTFSQSSSSNNPVPFLTPSRTIYPPLPITLISLSTTFSFSLSHSHSLSSVSTAETDIYSIFVIIYRTVSQALVHTFHHYGAAQKDSDCQVFARIYCFNKRRRWTRTDLAAKARLARPCKITI